MQPLVELRGTSQGTQSPCFKAKGTVETPPDLHVNAYLFSAVILTAPQTLDFFQASIQQRDSEMVLQCSMTGASPKDC